MLLHLNCNTLKFIVPKCYKTHKIQNPKTSIINIDSIIVYTAIKVRHPIYSPVYYYQDSLYCNYDTLKSRAIKRKQVYRNDQCQSLIDSIGLSLSKVKPFIHLLKDSSVNKLKSIGHKNCQFDFEVSDLFQIYIGNVMIRIGLLADNNKTYTIEGRSYKFSNRNNFHLLLYTYRNSASNFVKDIK